MYQAINLVPVAQDLGKIIDADSDTNKLIAAETALAEAAPDLYVDLEALLDDVCQRMTPEQITGNTYILNATEKLQKVQSAMARFEYARQSNEVPA